MAALIPIKVGGYAYRDPVGHLEMNRINDQIVKAPNFVDGGATYNPTDELIIGGAGLTLTTTLTCVGIDATGDVEIVGNVEVTGDSTLTGDVDVDGSVVVGASAVNGVAINAVGNGTGAGITCSGGSSSAPGLIAAPGASGQIAIQCFTGGVHWNGTQPAPTADPGENIAYAVSVARAWARISTDGVGGVQVIDAFNISSVAVTTTHLLVTFVRAFADNKYSPLITNGTATARFANYDQLNHTASTMRIQLRDQTGALVDLTTATSQVSLTVFGRQ
jgi:hypothetical protein